MVETVLSIVFKLFAFTIFGFFFFKIKIIKKHLLSHCLFITVNILIPLYFIGNISRKWSAVEEVGIYWTAIFFVSCIVMLLIQLGLAYFIVNKTRLLGNYNNRIMIILFAIHNAGYIPFPIIEKLAPSAVTVSMFFYVMCFQLIFWTVVVVILKGEKKIKLTFNMPLLGICLGLIIAVTGLFDILPPFILSVFDISAIVAMPAILFVLGGILASIPFNCIRYRKEFTYLILIKMILYPLAVLLIFWMNPFHVGGEEFYSGLAIAAVIEAAVPPATNIMIAIKMFGDKEDVHYAGSGMIFTYLATFVTLPLIILSAVILLN